MSMLLRLIVVLATFYLNFEVAVLQSSSDDTTTTKNVAATESLEIKYNRERTTDTNNQQQLLTFRSMNPPSPHPSYNARTDKTNTLIFQTQSNRSLRNTDTNSSNIHFSSHIPSVLKMRSLRNQIIKSDTPTGQIRALNTNKDISFNRTVSNNSKGISARTGESNNRNPGVPITGYSKPGITPLNSTKNETSRFSESNIVKFDKVFPSSSTKVSKDIQQTKTTSITRKIYGVNQCKCEHAECDCMSCWLTSVPKDLPTSITKLLLRNNGIEDLLKDMFSRYIHLEYLDISSNSLKRFQEGAFNGLSRLTYLDFSNNFIGDEGLLPSNIFEPLNSLTILHMEHIIFPCPISPRAFDAILTYLENIEEIYIDNYIDPAVAASFGPEFKNMSSLRRLTVICNACSMDTLWNSTFINLGHIISLDISECRIQGSHIEADTFSHLRSLETLNISQNKDIGMEYLPVIMCALTNSNLQTLSMNYIVKDNVFTTINSSLTECLPQTLTTLIARGNNIVIIDRNAVKSLPNSIKTIDIEDNYILTDPMDIPLEELVHLETLLISSENGECVNGGQYASMKTPYDQLKCQNSRTCMQKNKAVKSITGRKLNASLPETLKRVKVKVTSMHEDYMWNINVPNNLQELDLSCSYLRELDFGIFKSLPNLRSLNVRRSSVRNLIFSPVYDKYSLETLILEGNLLNDFINSYAAQFYNFVNLLNLDLSLNQLRSLPSDLFYGLEKLEYLRLDGNSFSDFGVDISNMTHLKQLNLSNTALSQLPSDTRAHIDQLCKVMPGQVRVDMSGCPIQCDCFNLDFLKWMASSTAFDKNFTGYMCRYSDTSLKYIIDGYKETIRVLDRECAKNYPMFLIVLAATSVLLCVVVGAVAYRFRWKIRYLYYAAYLKMADKRKNDNQHEFVYDVFISYDSEDQGFVTNHLSPELEKRGLRLLIHTRDFVAGTYIASNIVMAVADSRKTLVFLTRNLLESSWCNYELQMATMEAVHTGRQVLVFLMKENIPSKELDIDLLRHIRSNTYVPYPGPEEEGNEDVMMKFYDKLSHDLQG